MLNKYNMTAYWKQVLDAEIEEIFCRNITND